MRKVSADFVFVGEYSEVGGKRRSINIELTVFYSALTYNISLADNRTINLNGCTCGNTYPSALIGALSEANTFAIAELEKYQIERFEDAAFEAEQNAKPSKK